MEITLEMACSINGIIATKDGNEDFLLNRNWEIMLEFMRNQDVLIWGRKTFDSVKSWGDKYIKDLEKFNIIIISKRKRDYPEYNNVYCANSVNDCLNLCKEKGFKKLFISGGSTINSLFMEKQLVDNIILNYNPYVISGGIPLFKINNFQNKLKLLKVVKEKEGIIQIHYKVIKEKLCL